jgi:RND family efflux transporter MFP subunit
MSGSWGEVKYGVKLAVVRRYLTRRNIIFAVLILAAVGWWWWRGKNSEKNGQEVREATVERGEIVASLTLSGEVAADVQATLNFAGLGKVAYLGVKEGDEVKKWQVMAYQDPGDLDTAVTRAYYSYLAADANAKEVEDDLKDKGASESFDEKNIRVAAQTARDMAYDAWLAAQRAEKNAKLVAPFAGIVTGVTISGAGDTAGVTDGITVVDPKSLYFEMEVDESDIGKVWVGQETKVKLDAYEEETFVGKVKQIGFVAGLSSTGATIFKIKVDLGEEVVPKLRIGMNGDAEVILETKSGVLKLPIEAVIDGKVTLPGKEVKQVEVKTGIESENEVEIVSGLNEGDKVVIK